MSAVADFFFSTWYRIYVMDPQIIADGEHDSHEPLLVWESHEFNPRNHSSDWYWIVGIITVAIMAISIILGNIFLAIIIGLSVFLLAFLTTQTPDLVPIAIFEQGIQISHNFYSFKNLHSFAVVEREYTPKLIIRSKHFWSPYHIIKIEGLHPDDVVEVLQHYLPEDDHVEPLLYKVLDYLGF